MAEDRGLREFRRAVQKLPQPISCFSNGVACPWCGALHATVTFGQNQCHECERSFLFGYPVWHDSEDPVSWVVFPWRGFKAVGGKSEALADWEPNDRLKAIYFQKTEERLGVWADPSKPN